MRFTLGRAPIGAPGRAWLEPGWLAAAVLALVACSPALDWREARPEGDTLVLLFPCKPEAHQGTVPISGAPRPMRLLACEAAGAHFSLASLNAESADRVGPLLAAQKAALSANLAAAAPAAGPASSPGFPPLGATPNAGAARLSVAGRRPDGTALRAEAAFFVHGLRVYQATVLGEAPSAEAVGTFLGSARFAAATPGDRSAPR